LRPNDKVFVEEEDYTFAGQVHSRFTLSGNRVNAVDAAVATLNKGIDFKADFPAKYPDLPKLKRQDDMRPENGSLRWVRRPGGHGAL
jgi:hypothetical protein